MNVYRDLGEQQRSIGAKVENNVGVAVQTLGVDNLYIMLPNENPELLAPLLADLISTTLKI